MPLIKGKSKKSFGKNVSTEMDAGKPQDQALAIAYDVQRRSKKKMAKGGLVERDRRPSEDSQDAMEMKMEHMHPLDERIKKSDVLDKADADAHQMSKGIYPGMKMHHEYKQEMSHADDSDMEFEKKPMMESHGLSKQRMSHADEDEMSFQKRPTIEDHYEAMAGHDNDDSEMDMIDHIMRKKMAKGGMVDKSDSAEHLMHEEMEQPNKYYRENEHEALDWHMGDDMDSIHRAKDEDSHGMSDDYHSPKDMDMHADDDLQRDVVDHIDRIMSKMSRKKR